MAFNNPIDALVEARRAIQENAKKLPSRAANAAQDTISATAKGVKQTVANVGAIPYDPTAKLPTITAAPAADVPVGGAQPGAAEYPAAGGETGVAAGAVPASTTQVPAPGSFGVKGPVSGLSPQPVPAKPNSYLPQGVTELTPQNMRGGSNAPASGGTAAAQSPIMQQYNTLQAQKARDLDLQRQSLTNYLLQSATMTSPYDTVARARINAQQGRLGAQLARAPQATVAATTQENVAGKEAEGRKATALTGLEGQKIASEASKYGSDKSLEGTKTTAEANERSRQATADANIIAQQISSTATERAAQLGKEGRVEAAAKGQATKVVPLPNDPNAGYVVQAPGGMPKYETPKDAQQREMSEITAAQVPGVPFSYKGQRFVIDPKTNKIVPYKGA